MSKGQVEMRTELGWGRRFLRGQREIVDCRNCSIYSVVTSSAPQGVRGGEARISFYVLHATEVCAVATAQN